MYKHVVFLFLQEFKKFYGLDIRTVFYYCDNKVLATKINQKQKDFSKHTERYLLHFISTILPSSTKVQHVRAHQETKKDKPSNSRISEYSCGLHCNKQHNKTAPIALKPKNSSLHKR